MKKVTLFLLASVLVLVACEPNKYPDLEDGVYADIETNRGDILLKLYQEDTPLTVANFVSLAEGTNDMVSDSFKGKKYYDGLLFHRVMKDFMIQGGDPLANGTGGPGYRFEDEFPKDSTDKLKHRHDSAGVLSMANGGIGTNGSQFFITHKPTPWLDGVHTVFGGVQYGQGVVDSIEQNDTIKKVTIIKVGSKARGFNASKVFNEEFNKSIIARDNRIKEKEAAEVLRYEKFLKDKEVFQAEQGVAKAKETASGLKILTFKVGKGKKFDDSKRVSINYTISLADGTKIQSTADRGEEFSFILKNQPMIQGVTEALITMREGGKVRLFIPYNLAYGERAAGIFPAKADIVFDLEVVKVGEK